MTTFLNHEVLLSNEPFFIRTPLFNNLKNHLKKSSLIIRTLVKHWNSSGFVPLLIVWWDGGKYIKVYFCYGLEFYLHSEVISRLKGVWVGELRKICMINFKSLRPQGRSSRMTRVRAGANLPGSGSWAVSTAVVVVRDVPHAKRSRRLQWGTSGVSHGTRHKHLVTRRTRTLTKQIE